MSRATLNDLVEDFLRLELGYGEEFVVSNEVGTLYDVEETENLGKKLSELGIKDDSFLTVIDEDEENPRVNLVINVQESSTSPDEKPIKPADAQAGEKPIVDIPRRQKSIGEATGSANGATEPNGILSLKRKAEDPLESGKKRLGSDSQEDTPSVKRAKIAPGDGPIVLDDIDGSIVIDD